MAKLDLLKNILVDWHNRLTWTLNEPKLEFCDWNCCDALFQRAAPRDSAMFTLNCHCTEKESMPAAANYKCHFVYDSKPLSISFELNIQFWFAYKMCKNELWTRLATMYYAFTGFNIQMELHQTDKVRSREYNSKCKQNKEERRNWYRDLCWTLLLKLILNWPCSQFDQCERSTCLTLVNFPVLSWQKHFNANIFKCCVFFAIKHMCTHLSGYK